MAKRTLLVLLAALAATAFAAFAAFADTGPPSATAIAEQQEPCAITMLVIGSDGITIYQVAAVYDEKEGALIPVTPIFISQANEPPPALMLAATYSLGENNQEKGFGVCHEKSVLMINDTGQNTGPPQNLNVAANSDIYSGGFATLPLSTNLQTFGATHTAGVIVYATLNINAQPGSSRLNSGVNALRIYDFAVVANATMQFNEQYLTAIGGSNDTTLMVVTC